MTTGSDWDEYSEFEFRWVEILLTKNTLNRETIVFLSNKFGSNIKNIDSVDTPNIGNILINDIPKDTLMPILSTLLKNDYSKKLSFEEAQIVFNSLNQLSINILKKILLKISKNKNIQSILKIEEEDPKFSVEKIGILIIGELYMN